MVAGSWEEGGEGKVWKVSEWGEGRGSEEAVEQAGWWREQQGRFLAETETVLSAVGAVEAGPGGREAGRLGGGAWGCRGGPRKAVAASRRDGDRQRGEVDAFVLLG